MSKKLTKKEQPKVEEEVKEEIVAEEEVNDLDSLLNAKFITQKKLYKAYTKKENLQDDIDSMELSLELISEELKKAGYDEEAEEE
jgi:hypothetical protein